MSDNPFQPPKDYARNDIAAGTLDVGGVISAGFDAFMRNPGAWLVGSLVYLLGAMVSAIMCFFPAFFVVPLLYHGFMVFAYKGLTGTPSLDDITASFDDPMNNWVAMVAYALLMVVIFLPGLVIYFGGSLVGALLSDSIVGTLITFTSFLIYMAYALVVPARFWAAPFLIAVEKQSPTDALTTSWNLTESSWLPLIALTFIAGLMTQIGAFLCLVGLFPAMCIVAAMQAAAYAKLRNLPVAP